jgi:hypothetical protein
VCLLRFLVCPVWLCVLAFCALSVFLVTCFMERGSVVLCVLCDVHVFLFLQRGIISVLCGDLQRIRVYPGFNILFLATGICPGLYAHAFPQFQQSLLATVICIRPTFAHPFPASSKVTFLGCSALNTVSLSAAVIRFSPVRTHFQQALQKSHCAHFGGCCHFVSATSIHALCSLLLCLLQLSVFFLGCVPLCFMRVLARLVFWCVLVCMVSV